MFLRCCSSCCLPCRTQKVALVSCTDRAGATTLAHHMQFARHTITVPTVVTEKWKVTKNGTRFLLLDVGRDARNPVALRQLLKGVSGVIVVIDSSIAIERSRPVFDAVVSSVSPDLPMYIVANKQDTGGAMIPIDVCSGLGLRGGRSGGFPVITQWACQPCVANHPNISASRILDFFLSRSVAPLVVPQEVQSILDSACRAQRGPHDPFITPAPTSSAGSSLMPVPGPSNKSSSPDSNLYAIEPDDPALQGGATAGRTTPALSVATEAAKRAVLQLQGATAVSEGTRGGTASPLLTVKPGEREQNTDDDDQQMPSAALPASSHRSETKAGVGPNRMSYKPL